MYRQPPCHVSKAAVKKFPFVGTIADMCGCLFIDRGNSKARMEMLDKIKGRQVECEQGVYPPLIIYPEGGTTNGSCLVKFKKGAFSGLRSVKPLIFKYKYKYFNIENSVLNFVAMTALMATNFYGELTISEMPVFMPNEYFFKHHSREGEEKWETYARVMRDLMALESGLEISELAIEEKYKYKELLFPNIKGKHSD